MKKLGVILMVCVLLGLVVGGAYAQSGAGDSPVPTPTAPAPTPAPIEPGSIPELPALLSLLAGPQGWVVLGGLISMLLAKWPWYIGLPSARKQTVFIGLTVVASTLSYVLITYIPENFWAATAPFWGIIAGVAMTWGGGNLVYLLGVKPNNRT